MRMAFREYTGRAGFGGVSGASLTGKRKYLDANGIHLLQAHPSLCQLLFQMDHFLAKLFKLRPWYPELESALLARRHIRFGSLAFRWMQDSLSANKDQVSAKVKKLKKSSDVADYEKRKRPHCLERGSQKKHLSKLQHESPISYPPSSEPEDEDDGDSLSSCHCSPIASKQTRSIEKNQLLFWHLLSEIWKGRKQSQLSCVDSWMMALPFTLFTSPQDTRRSRPLQNWASLTSYQ
ncbi:unnamed protein product, partial [Darwinula stevensoni]